LSLTLSAGSSDRGGSGSAAKQGVVPFALAVRRSAILAAEAIHDTTLTAAGDEARIVGGEETHDYPAVGAILQNGLMHCTGTLIGPHTVLTAGHCLYKRETRDLVFVQGTYALDQGNIRRRATAKAMPNDGDFRYDDPSLHDDVGLLYVGDPAATETMKLHVGEPPLRDLVKHQRELAFIGFGYTLVRGNKAGLGTKRHVDMPINGFAARTFTYRVARKNTCNGDSGGPAFVESANELWLAGITSSGDTPCTDHGTDTRVESFMSWISPRIR
jgi:secreted trypsin-like serine protease